VTGRTYLSLEDILLLHATLLERFGGESGILSLNSIESAIARPKSGYYKDPIEEGCALFQSLWTNHGFIDGNKRVAFAALNMFLEINGFQFRRSTSNLFLNMLEQEEKVPDFEGLVKILSQSVHLRSK
jgi:death on curing protein